jgi:copper chaperone CopZ
MKRLILPIGLFIILTTSVRSQDHVSDQTVLRATAILNGVFSPRGFFNIMVRLYQLDGVAWAKLDLKKSQITLDFQPGVTATPEAIHQVMIDAGYKPGPVKMESLRRGEVVETGPGWVKIKHPKSSNPIARWFELNF